MIDTIEGRAPGIPGFNLDKLSVEAGLAEAASIGYVSGNERMLVDYCLSRHAIGEEDLAQRTALSMGIDLTGWYRILAAARAAV